MMTGKQGQERRENEERNQEWVEGWISWISLQTSLSMNLQKSESKADLIHKWLCDNQEVGEDEVIDVEENETGEEKIREKQNKTLPFVVLPFSRKVLPIIPRHVSKANIPILTTRENDATEK